MREILFRGRRIDNGEWAEGLLAKHPSSIQVGNCSPWYISVPPKDPDDNGGLYNVVPSTVGQYTGLKDRNSVRIFEGDVLQITEPRGTTERCIVGYGIYKPFSYSAKNIGFYLYWEKDEWQHQKYANIAYWIEEREAICIGNIHDNPELMGVRG